MRSSLIGILILASLAAGCATSGSARKGPTTEDIDHMQLAMAEALVHDRAYDQALPYLKSLLPRFSKSSRLHLLMAIVLREKSILDAAEQEAKLALELAPRDPETQTVLGTIHCARENLGLAEQHCRRAVELAPRDARYRNNLGFMLLLLKRYDDAKRELTEAIRIDPGMKRAFNNLGFVHGLSGNTEEAMRAFSQAGSRSMAMTNLGFIQEMKGRPGQARRLYERALQLDGRYEPALQNLKAVSPNRTPDDGDTKEDKKTAPRQEDEQ